MREWLKSLSPIEKRTIGEDVKTVQLGWPLGMPLVRKLEPGLWEILSNLPSGIARIMFTVKDNAMILLHGFIKKPQKTPMDDLYLARERLEVWPKSSRNLRSSDKLLETTTGE